MFSGALVLSPDLHSKNIHLSHLSQILNHNFKTTQLVTVPVDEVMCNLCFTKKPLNQKLAQCPRETEGRNCPEASRSEVSSAFSTPTFAESLVGRSQKSSWGEEKPRDVQRARRDDLWAPQPRLRERMLQVWVIRPLFPKMADSESPAPSHALGFAGWACEQCTLLCLGWSPVQRAPLRMQDPCQPPSQHPSFQKSPQTAGVFSL